MRRLLSSLTAVTLLAAQQAQAQPLDCLSPAQRAAVEIAALRSELMVLATGCHDDDGYNAFIRKYQPELMGNEQAIAEMFKQKYGRRGQQEHDQFTTDLANAESSAGMHLGSDFCARNGLMFQEVLALTGPGDLATYAAGKDLVPRSFAVCTEVAMSEPPAHKVVARKHH